MLRAMLLAFLIAGCTPAQEAPPSLAPLSPAGTVTAPPLDETPNASSDVVEIDVNFEEVQYVKIYDAQGQTGQPYEPGSSIPFCLEP